MKKSIKPFALSCLVGAACLVGTTTLYAQVTSKTVPCNWTALSITHLTSNLGNLGSVLKVNRDDVGLKGSSLCTMFYSKGEPVKFTFKDKKTGKVHVYVKQGMNGKWQKSS